MCRAPNDESLGEGINHGSILFPKFLDSSEDCKMYLALRNVIIIGRNLDNFFSSFWKERKNG